MLAIWTLFSLSIYAQSNCGKYNISIRKVDKNYSQLSNKPYPNYFKFALPQKDSLRLNLFNTHGELVYKEDFGLIEAGTYIIKFYNPECPGIYFVSTATGNQPAFTKFVHINSEAFPNNVTETNIDTTTSLLDGIWRKSYAEKIVPYLQPDNNHHKIECHFKYNLKLQFVKGLYKIETEIINEDNGGKNTKIARGKYIVRDDSLKLFEESKLIKIFQYRIERDTLSLLFFVSKDTTTGAMVIPMSRSIENTDIKLVGRYHRETQEK